MLYLVKLLDGKPVCCGGITFPDDVSRASAESDGYICMESDTEPEFFTRWVHTTPESPDNVGDESSGIGSIAIVLTDAEYDTVLADSARHKRDRLIAATDYLVTPDYPIDPEKLVKIKTYRQALRDIPEQSGFPRSITWPDKP